MWNGQTYWSIRNGIVRTITRKAYKIHRRITWIPENQVFGFVHMWLRGHWILFERKFMYMNVLSGLWMLPFTCHLWGGLIGITLFIHLLRPSHMPSTVAEANQRWRPFSSNGHNLWHRDNKPCDKMYLSQHSYYCTFFFFLIFKMNPTNPLAFKSQFSGWHCLSIQLLCSIIEKQNMGRQPHVFLSTNSYLCLPYLIVLWEVRNSGSFLNLIIWSFPTTVCLLLTCQISFCSHIFGVCLLDIDNSGWCKSLSTFDSENVIKKGNTKMY